MGGNITWKTMRGKTIALSLRFSPSLFEYQYVYQFSSKASLQVVFLADIKTLCLKCEDGWGLMYDEVTY